MKFIEITEKQKEKFQSLVKTNGSFLQDWEWGEFQKSLGRNVKRFAIEEQGEDIGTKPGNIYSFAGQGYFSPAGAGKTYFFMPYGPVIFPGTGDDKFQARLDYFCSQIKKMHPETLFVRFERLDYFAPGEVAHAVKTKDVDPKKTLILDISMSEEEILAQMHAKTRYNIRLAQKKDVQIKVTKDLGGAVMLFEETAKRAGIRAFDKSYYEKLVSFFAENPNIQTKVYSAWHDQDLLAVNIMLYYNHGFFDHQMTYLFGGSSEMKRNLMPTYALHWQAILDAKKEGYRQYDFWGVEEDPNHPWYGFSKFKLGFGGRVGTHAGTYDYMLNPTWYNVYKILRKLNRLIRK